MAEVKGYQCDKCKELLRAGEGIRIEGEIFQINNRPEQILVKINKAGELDICPHCFWYAMTPKFRDAIKENIKKSGI